MSLEDQIIDLARQVAREEAGSDDDAITVRVLARMLFAAVSGASHGFLRLPPSYTAKLSIRNPDPLS